MAVITRFGLLPRLPGTSVESFQEHWRTVHAEAAVGMPGIRRYWQNHRALDVTPALPWPGFDACSEIDADSVPAHLGMRFSPAYEGPVAADEPTFMDMTRNAAVWTRRRATDGLVGDGLRLLTFLRLAPLHGIASLTDALCGRERGPEATGREVFVSLHARDASQMVSVFDAVEALWFADAAAATAYLREGAERDRATIAGLVQGTERVLARVVRVV